MTVDDDSVTPGQSLLRVGTLDANGAWQIREVPAGDVPVGYRRHRDGGASFYVAPDEIAKLPPRASRPQIHPPVHPAVRVAIERLARELTDVCPRTVDEWVAYFRGGLYPWTSLAAWEKDAMALAHFGCGPDGEPAAETCRDVYAVLLEFKRGPRPNDPPSGIGSITPARVGDPGVVLLRRGSGVGTVPGSPTPGPDDARPGSLAPRGLRGLDGRR